MSTTTNRFLRTVLLVDAATCLGAGTLMSFGAAFLSPMLGLPGALLLEAGIVLFPVAAFIAFVATRVRLSPLMVWLVIAGNVLWILGSVGVLVGSEPTALGQAFVVAQAAAVAVLTALEFHGVRQLAPGEAIRTGTAPSR